MKKISQICLFSIALFIIYIPSSFAYLGLVEGHLKFFNKLGHYCANDGRDCSDAKYKEADFSKKQPLREVYVRLYVNGIFVGQGSTDKYGRYLISYSSPIEPPFSLKVQTNLKHKDGRFQVRKPNGGEYSMIGYKAIYYSSPNGFGYHYNHLGTMNWGSSNAPIDAINTYNGAWRTWHYAFDHSARLRNHFNGIDIYNNVPVAVGSYYDNSDSRIYIDSSRQYEYSVIYHELGHAASYKATKGQTRYGHTGYCYPQSSCSNGSHNFQTQEWASPQFSEGMASFLGQVGAFWSGNSDPIICSGRAQIKCPSSDTPSSFDLETSKFSACTTADSRYELNASKYLRDLYDSNDYVDLSFSQMVEGIYAFQDHDENRGKNEHWDIGWFWDSIDNLDGRSTGDYRYLIDNLYNISSSNSNYLFSANCDPQGAGN